MTEAEIFNSIPKLSEDDKLNLKNQNSRLVTEFKALSLEKDAKKHWDLFYKRNEARFFKDRHWTTREFEELLNEKEDGRRTLLEVGCGVGNFIYPLIEENLNFYVIACDLSSRAVEILKQNSLYNEEFLRAFQVDVTTDEILDEVELNSVDIVTLIFVLSAIHPEKFVSVLKRMFKLLKPGGMILFRDYGLYDMAQLRFKSGHKIAENFYMRQDGTRSYYFSIEFFSSLLKQTDFHIDSINYIHRRTVNKKENIDVPRVFIQAKISKPK